MSDTPIVNPIPPAAVALAVVIVGIEALFGLAEHGILGGPTGIGWRVLAIENWAFFGASVDWMLSVRRTPPDLLVRLVTYTLLHLGFLHALMAGAFILALGKMVGEAFGNLALLAFFFLPAVTGALAFAVLLDAPYPLIGAFPGVYGLIGGYTFLLWTRAAEMKRSQLRAFRLAGVLLGVQLVLGLAFGATGHWVAELAGFATGFAMSFLLVPGGWRRLRERLRGR